MDANMDRTTLIVGDLHLKQESLFPLIDGAIEHAGATDVILCGDYMDDWGADSWFSLDALSALIAWIDGKRDAGIAVTPLVGNHDFCYINHFIGCGTDQRIIDDVGWKLKQMGLRAAAVADGRLVTHAGVTGGWHDRYIPDTETSYEIADALNEMLDGTVTFARCLYEAGYGRGGGSLTPSPLWADMNELLDDPAPYIDQIVGHTPVMGADTHVAHWYGDGQDDGASFVSFCDTFSLRRDLVPLGNGSMLLVGGGKVKSISNRVLWKKCLSNYRIARGVCGVCSPVELDGTKEGKWIIEDTL